MKYKENIQQADFTKEPIETITPLGEDALLIERMYDTLGKNYIVMRIQADTAFTKFPAGKGDIFLYNCGSFVLMDTAKKGELIERNNLQKGTLLKINENIRNNVYFSIPKFGLKDDSFYGILVY